MPSLFYLIDFGAFDFPRAFVLLNQNSSWFSLLEVNFFLLNVNFIGFFLQGFEFQYHEFVITFMI